MRFTLISGMFFSTLGMNSAKPALAIAAAVGFVLNLLCLIANEFLGSEPDN